MQKIEVKAIEPITISVEDAASLLGVSESTMRQLVHRADFPKFKLPGRILINVRRLQDWVDANTEPEYGVMQP